MPRGRPKGSKEPVSRKWNHLASEYIHEIDRAGFSLSWIKKMRAVLKEVPLIIKDVKSPVSITREQYIGYLDHLISSHENTDYRKQKLSCFNRFLARYENYVFSSVHYKWEPHVPKNIYWLTPEEIGMIWATPMDPVERIIIWMESKIGARRIEVMRQRVEDIDFRYGRIYLRGKGGQGHKGRRLAIPPSGSEELPKFLDVREGSVNRMLEMDPEALIPPELVVYWTTGKNQKLTTLKATMADTFIERVSERSGIVFTHHTLRRSYARHLYNQKIELEKIAKVLGHSSVKTTERYIGISDDDVAEAMFQGEMEIVPPKKELIKCP